MIKKESQNENAFTIISVSIIELILAVDKFKYYEFIRKAYTIAIFAVM